MLRVSAICVLCVLLTGAPASGQITGVYARGHFAPDPAHGDSDRPDLIAVTNGLATRILSFGMYLSRGVDADGDGIGLFFDTIAPSAGAPPSSVQLQPGYAGAARLRVEPVSAALVGYEAASELFVPYPGTLLGPEGDGAVQLVTIACDHFDPGETILLGVDVDGFDDFLGVPTGDDPPPAGSTVAAGQSVVDGMGQVYFDIVSGEVPTPVPVPVRTPWLLLGGTLVVVGLARQNRDRRTPGFW